MISNLNPFYINSKYALRWNDDRTDFTFRVNFDEFETVDHCNVTSLSVNNNIILDTDTIYLHATCVQNNTCSDGDGIGSSNIISSFNVKRNQFSYFADNEDFTSTIKRFISKTQEITFYLTDENGEKIKLDNEHDVDFTFYLMKVHNIGEKLDTLTDLMLLLIKEMKDNTHELRALKTLKTVKAMKEARSRKFR